MLQSITEYYRVLQSVTECYRVFLAHLLGPIFGLVCVKSASFVVFGIIFLALNNVWILDTGQCPVDIQDNNFN